MRSQHLNESSGRGETTTRPGAGGPVHARAGTSTLAAALACVLAALTLLGPMASGAAAAGGGRPGASGAAAPGDAARGPSADASDASGLGAVEALIVALGADRAERAVDAIGHGLAMMEAQKRIAATERKLAKEAATEEARAEEAEAAPVVEEVKNPSEMPPASAGSNGTTVPHSGGGRLFAHTRATADGSTAILLSGIALAPPDAPETVQNVINAANTIVGRPYIWGGGHGSFYSYGYDCSGSVSFALFGGGLIPEPLTSGSLEGWGAPGPGKWVTVYANAGHTFMEIAGLRWDTVGDARGTGPRWHLAPTDTSGFVVRHPAGL
jgi:cell wall-associated NlpC family hydrolase